MVIHSLRRGSGPSAQRSRLVALAIILGLWGCGVIGRLVQLQVLQHEQLLARAIDQQTDVVKISGKRGDILARGGQPLATTIDVGSIYAHPRRIQDPVAVAALLAPLLNRPVDMLVRELSTDKKFAYLDRKAHPDTVERVRRAVLSAGLQGQVWYHDETKRFYPHRSLAAHVIGHVNLDNRGMAGVERFYDRHIRGEDGTLNTMRDGGNGATVGDRGGALENPTRGDDLVLTIDWTLQYVTERALQQAVESKGATGGSAVVLDPRNGEILAMASYPYFNPNVPNVAMVDNGMNRPVQRPFEPGSIFKVFTAAAALHEGVVDEDEPIDCQGGRYPVANWVYRDWKPGFGIMPFRDVLANSSNVGTIKVCSRMAPETYFGWVRDFGFGSLTGVDLPNEEPGLLQSVDRWSKLTQSSMAFGQEISATPLQVATALSVIANGGLLVRPHVLLEVRRRDGETIRGNEPEIRRRVLNEGVAHRVAAMMEHVVRNGTGKPAQLGEFRVAGKTSTAQQIDPDTGAYSRFTAGFGGFMPVSDPRVVIVVTVDDPQRRFGHGGSQAAAPAFREIAETAVRVFRLRPDAIEEIPAWVTEALDRSTPARPTGGVPPLP